ncbi:hypothetical protein GCM10010343_09080 [Streptomyces avidinii]|nr:hypothetical protein GCM10010343_09080 [Streptomyces avidinii]
MTQGATLAARVLHVHGIPATDYEADPTPTSRRQGGLLRRPPPQRASGTGGRGESADRGPAEVLCILDANGERNHLPTSP